MSFKVSVRGFLGVFFLTEIGKLVVKLPWKCKGPRTAEAILKNKTHPDISAKALVIKIMWYWHVDKLNNKAEKAAQAQTCTATG